MGIGPWHCMIKFRVIFGNLSTLTTGTYLYLRNLEVVYGPLQCVMSMQQNACSVVYQQPLEFSPHSYFVDFTSHALFYIMTSLPAFVKVGKTPAILEKQAVNMFI